MSLPIHLQKIKSSGVYRFVYDKSVISGQTAETLRLLVGYSDKGPFNTPVYIETREDFIKTYGNISKRLEKKGIYFHRLALEALNGGPILCLNLKNFTSEDTLGWVYFDPNDIYTVPTSDQPARRTVTSVYDTNRFWTVKPEDQVAPGGAKYIVITTTDTKDAACSIIMRKAVPAEYDLTIREYYAGTGEELPDYLTNIQDTKLNEYFMDIYVFRGQFTTDLCGPTGPLGRYFNVDGTTITLEENYTDAFGEPADALTALASDPASNYISGYRGTTIPFFKNANGSYISLDILFNSDFSSHKMLMNMNEELLTPETASAKLLVPYLDNVNSDMSDDVVVYKNKVETSYSYVVLSNPTADEQSAAVEKTEVPAPVDITADDPAIIKISNGADPAVYTYYKKEALSGFAYVVIDNPTSTQKKKAVEVTAEPNPVTADSPAIIKLTTVTEPNISPLYLVGFDYSDNVVSTEQSLNVITGDYGKGLQEALTNRVDVEYHYLVDTFDTATYNNKTTLAALARKKDNCFAILNFPKIADYKKDQTNFTNNTIDFNKVVKKFILPDDVDGASWCGYFTQIVLTDGTVRTTVPSAGLVSNLFMDKWVNRQPYYIVAGSQYGRLLDGTLVGPDFAFSKTDRDVLEPFGINVIVYEPRRGTYINSEQTAKQIPVSALSKIHIRELVIYLQDEIAELLEGYRWELNTQTLRDKIKNKADVILETVKNNGGVYDYLNVCDESNNTPETIDNEFLILDTHIEPARGAGKMVEQLYIYRTGEMRSTLLQG